MKLVLHLPNGRPDIAPLRKRYPDIEMVVSRELPDLAREIRGAEIFITSTAGGVMPVTRITGRPVGDGSPGPLTQRLNKLYWSKKEAGWLGTPIDYRRESDDA